ncbi:MAG: type II toxin-antitoxin system RelE/ParE family toxin [Verrucomicrobiae bacterium]|nr:type II toxin-antitoxin system RelE/ParE family toxin [Verrucomicrobiae bacterium]
MDFKVIWFPSARLELKEIVSYIAKDSAEIAKRFGLSLINATKAHSSYPKKGRLAPEFFSQDIKMVIFKPYRNIYRVKEFENLIEDVRVWHAARGTPEL